MSAKIRVSYEQPEELQQILCKLGQGVKSVRSPRQQTGRYKKAYIDFEVVSTQKPKEVFKL